MKPGDRVQVWSPWAYDLNGPLYSWSEPRTVEEVDEATKTVVVIEDTYGWPSRHDLKRVRTARPGRLCDDPPQEG